MKLDYLKMLKEIDELTETNFCEEMCKKRGFSKLFTRQESNEMAKLLGEVYLIAHSIHCEACGRKYEFKNKT